MLDIWHRQGPTKKDSNWYLIEKETSNKVKLSLDMAPFRLYSSDGNTCLSTAATDATAYCTDMFDKRAHTSTLSMWFAKSKNVTKNDSQSHHGADRPKVVKGMTAKGQLQDETHQFYDSMKIFTYLLNWSWMNLISMWKCVFM